MTNVLVTGLGSIGIATIRKFVKEGFNVVSYDVASDSPRVTSALRGVEGKIKYVRGDVDDQFRLIDISKENEIEGIIHTAALTGRGSRVDFPTPYFSVNAGGVLNVLETARILGLGRVIFTGSVSMYGDTEEPCMETDLVNPLNIASFYDFAKYTGENLMHTYHNVFGMDTVICRLHNAYGIGEIRPKAIGTWLWSVMRGENVVEATGADNRDDNSYSGDIAEGVYLLYMTKKITEPRIYNVSDGVTRRHGDIVEVINRMGSGEIVLGPGKGGIYGKPMYRKEELKDKMEVGGKYVKGGSPLICDITRMKELGFRPRSIEENIAEYAEWIKEEINRLGPLAKPRETY